MGDIELTGGSLSGTVTLGEVVNDEGKEDGLLRPPSLLGGVGEDNVELLLDGGDGVDPDESGEVTDGLCGLYEVLLTSLLELLDLCSTTVEHGKPVSPAPGWAD